jgi:uncharacterized protein (DUF2235 family)
MKNLIVCFDGTHNEFGTNNTNVVRLIQSLDRDPAKQRLHYIPGIGTFPPTPDWNVFESVSQLLGDLFDLLIAWRLESIVQDAYTYVMNNWAVGDRVYLFGFSRGSYTARVLAGMLHFMGLLPRGSENLVPYAMQMYRSARRGTFTSKGRQVNRWKLCNQFRKTFSRKTGHKTRRFETQFVGLWDTVSTVGWIWNPTAYPNTRTNPSIKTIRHAVSIDERRAFYRQNLFAPGPKQDAIQMWFAGVHSDVGGGYPEGHLWWYPFVWMVEEARSAGVHFDDLRLTEVLKNPPSTTAFCGDEPHKSLHGPWYALEFIPKRQWQWDTSTSKCRCGCCGYRFVPPGSLIHGSALRRLKECSKYDPPNLSPAFKTHVRQLTEIPNWLVMC